VTGYIPRWFRPTRTQTVTHGWESNSRPVDHKSDALTTKPPKYALDTYLDRWWFVLSIADSRGTGCVLLSHHSAEAAAAGDDDDDDDDDEY